MVMPSFCRLQFHRSVGHVPFQRRILEDQIPNPRLRLDPDAVELQVAGQRESEADLGDRVSGGLLRIDTEIGNQAEALVIQKGQGIAQRARDRERDIDVLIFLVQADDLDSGLLDDKRRRHLPAPAGSPFAPDRKWRSQTRP